MFKLLKKDKNARLGEFHTVHGVIKTPVFMNVGTAAAIKGGLDSFEGNRVSGRAFKYLSPSFKAR